MFSCRNHHRVPYLDLKFAYPSRRGGLTLKILIVADEVDPRLYEHFNPERFPPIDMIISCGDLKPWYLSYLMSCFNAPLYYVRGNHDRWKPGEETEGGENLDGRLLVYKGIRMIGFEGSRYYGSPDAIQYTERQMSWKAWRLKWSIWRRNGVDIIVTHAPPFGIHDADDVCHTGFHTFIKLLHKYKPKYFIHGHTHLNYGHNLPRVTVIDNTTVINGYGFFLLDYGEGVSENIHHRY